MDSKPEDFKDLCRLLALKRHEQPPPGFFEDFSRSVIYRLNSGEADRESFVERLSSEAPWLGRFVEVFAGKPLWAGAVGAAACGLVIGSMVWLENLDVTVAKDDLTHPALALPVEQASFVFNQLPTQPQPTALTNSGDQLNVPNSLFNGPALDIQRTTQPAIPLLQR